MIVRCSVTVKSEVSGEEINETILCCAFRSAILSFRLPEWLPLFSFVLHQGCNCTRHFRSLSFDVLSEIFLINACYWLVVIVSHI